MPKPPRVERGRQRAKVSIHDVAREARVSTATVSNVYNRPEVVAEQTRLRVEQAIATVGYVPDTAARVMRGAANPVVGCILLDVANPFYAEICRGIEDGLRPRGFLALIGSSDVDGDREREYLQLMRSQRVRGIILNPTESGLAALAQVRESNLPVVLVDHPQNGNDLCAVTPDHELGGYLVARHLLELGHRTLTLLSPPARVEGLRLREAGARRACHEAGLDEVTALRLVQLGTDADGDLLVEDCITRVLQDERATTALICFNDITALRALHRLRELGVRVPDDISVTGYDDLAFAALLTPTLTTVRQPARRLGLLAARSMLQESDPAHRHLEHVLGVDLMVRGSTGPPA